MSQSEIQQYSTDVVKEAIRTKRQIDALENMLAYATEKLKDLAYSSAEFHKTRASFALRELTGLKESYDKEFE